MKISAIEQDFPYLAARGDNRGSFVDWLTTLHVKIPGGATIADLIAWGWIRPDFRVVLPESYFLGGRRVRPQFAPRCTASG